MAAILAHRWEPATMRSGLPRVRADVSQNIANMNNSESYYQPAAVAEMDAQSRGTFVSRTYAHLFGAVVGFILIEVFLFKTGLALTLARAMLGVSWLLVLGGFVVVSWLASRVAHTAVSKGAQYAA